MTVSSYLFPLYMVNSLFSVGIFHVSWMHLSQVGGKWALAGIVQQDAIQTEGHCSFIKGTEFALSIISPQKNHLRSSNPLVTQIIYL